MGGFAGRQQRADVETARGEVEVGILVVLGAVGIAAHALWCRRLQRVQQPGGAGFAQGLVGGGVVGEEVRCAIANPEQVFEFEAARLLNVIGDAVVAAVAAGGLLVDMGADVARAKVGWLRVNAVVKRGAFVRR